MPYAKRRNSEALNCAYAHLASPSFSVVATQLTDKLIEMGFEPLEAAGNITQGNPNQTDVFDDQDSVVVRTEPTLRVEMAAAPELTPETSANVVITPTANNTFSIEVKGIVSPETKTQLLKAATSAHKQQLSAQIEQHNLRIAVARAPSQSGKTFAPLPQLCYKQYELWDLLDTDAILHWRKAGFILILSWNCRMGGYWLLSTRARYMQPMMIPVKNGLSVNYGQGKARDVVYF